MARLLIAGLLPVVAAFSVAGSAHAHDVAHPFVDPNAKIEAAAKAVFDNAKAAQAAGVSEKALQTARFVVWLDLAWSRHDITVCFWNGTTELQDFVMQTAQVWPDNADIRFVYQTNGQNNICQDGSSADIRINLDPNAPLSLFANQAGSEQGDWSYLGRVSLNPKHLVTMNLRDIDEGRTADPLWTTHAIRHEFGHALALAHEHQRALCDPWFDFDKIAKLSGWSIETAKEQVGKFADSDIQYLASVGGYDINSIMQYNFDPEEFKQIPGQTNPCLREVPIDNLSPQDIAGIQALYGAPAGAAAMMSARSGAEAAMIPADATDAEVSAMRADLSRLHAMMQADGTGTNRSGAADPQQKAAFDGVIDSIKTLEELVPPR